MVHHLIFCKLQPEVSPEKLDEILRSTRSQLAKVPQVLSVRSGRNVDPDSPWHFFVCVELESMEKLAIYRDDPIHIKYLERILKPWTVERQTHDFVTD